MNYLELLLIGILLVGSYLLLCGRLAYLFQPLRLEMAELADELVESKRLSDSQLLQVCKKLETAYDAWQAWYFVLLVPAGVVWVLYDQIRGIKDPPEPALPKDLKLKLKRFERLSLVSHFANSPLAAFVFALEIAIFLILFVPLGAVLGHVNRIMTKRPGNNHHHGPREAT